MASAWVLCICRKAVAHFLGSKERSCFEATCQSKLCWDNVPLWSFTRPLMHHPSRAPWLYQLHYVCMDFIISFPGHNKHASRLHTLLNIFLNLIVPYEWFKSASVTRAFQRQGKYHIHEGFAACFTTGSHVMLSCASLARMGHTRCWLKL